MQSNDPPPPDEPALARDTLRRLEERLDRASAAAERLIAEAASQAGQGSEQDAEGPSKPPPAGWQTPSAADEDTSYRELELLSDLLRSVRDLIPLELQRRLAAALRELLLALRALIDVYLERLERRGKSTDEVEDIPIS